MSISKAQQKATAKYVRQNYDRIEVKVPKGDKEVLQAHAQAQGESLNKFINRAITDRWCGIPPIRSSHNASKQSATESSCEIYESKLR